MRRGAIPDGHRPDVKAERCIGTCICQCQYFAPQTFARQTRGIAGHKSLARGRCFTRVRRDIRVGTQQMDIVHRYPQRLRKNLRNYRIGPLPDISRTLMQKKIRPSAVIPDLIVDGLGSEVLPHPYQPAATPTPRFRDAFSALNAAQSAFSPAARRGARPADKL